MAYQGFCGMFEKAAGIKNSGKWFGGAFAHGVAFAACAVAGQTYGPIAVGGIMVGVWAAASAHERLSKAFKARAVAKKKGNRLVKLAQATAFAIPVSIAVALSSDAEHKTCCHPRHPQKI